MAPGYGNSYGHGNNNGNGYPRLTSRALFILYSEGFFPSNSYGNNHRYNNDHGNSNTPAHKRAG